MLLDLQCSVCQICFNFGDSVLNNEHNEMYSLCFVKDFNLQGIAYGAMFLTYET